MQNRAGGTRQLCPCSEEAELGGRFVRVLLLCTALAHLGGDFRQAPDVGFHVAAQAGVTQRRRRVEEGVVSHQGLAAEARLAMDAADAFIWEVARHAEAAQRGDDGRLDDGQLLVQPGLAGEDFVGARIAVVGRAVLDDVGDEDLLTLHVDQAQQVLEVIAGAPDERQAAPVFVKAGAFTNEDDVGRGAAAAGHGVVGALVQAAFTAGTDLFGDGGQALCAWIAHESPV